MSCDAYLMRRAYYAGESGKEAHGDKGEISEWAFIKVKESYDNVASEDIGRLSIAQNILRKSTDVLRRIIALASGVGGVTLSYVCRRCNCFHLRITSGGVVGARRRQERKEAVQRSPRSKVPRSLRIRLHGQCAVRCHFFS